MNDWSGYTDYLLNDLADLVKDEADPKKVFIALCAIMVGGREIGETQLLNYLAPLEVRKEILIHVCGDFVGWGELVLICECEDSATCFFSQVMASQARGLALYNYLCENHKDARKLTMKFGTYFE